ncbi:MAG: porphobilinogen synthase [Candidatus Omnitrophica bacterium]|nr:porphobilinogen synthase [Candidatus Omnitrophota bacterium]
MKFPIYRSKRIRQNDNFRRLLQETRLSPDNLIMPFFVREGKSIKKPIVSLPGNFQLSIDNLIKEVKTARSLDIPAVLLFGIPDKKDETGSAAYSKEGIVQKAITAIKEKVPGILVIADVCLCEFTSTGHCGIIKSHQGSDCRLDNDATLDLLARTAFSQVAGSAPKFGNRNSYQMDPANSREAMREISLDVKEGADIIMVKPALAYLDIIAKAREKFNLPIAAYNVSGEFSMVKAAAKAGWIDEEKITLEILNAIKRAGADIIITYHAMEIAKIL